jgi:multidrug resistance efflux pump
MNDNPEKPEPIMAKLAEPKTGELPDRADGKDGVARVVTGLVVGLLILGWSAYAAYYFWTNQKETERRPKRTNTPSVQGVRLQPTDFTIHLPSQGRVQAQKLSSINPEVAGRIVSIEPAFKEGGFFVPGQKLLALDNFDYTNAVAKAKATISQLNAKLKLERIERAAFKNAVEVARENLKQAEVALKLDKIESASYASAVAVANANLAQAQANERIKLAEQAAAIANLKRLGKLEGASALAKKEPQMAEAKANTLAKEVALNKAQEDLKRPAQSAADLRAKRKVTQVQLTEAEENLKRPDQREADIQAQIDIARSEARQATQNAERTIIFAPNYHGRITEKRVDIGQVVTTGMILATAITTEDAEVRLPISNQRLAYLNLPEQLVDTNKTQAHEYLKTLTGPNDEGKPSVTLTKVIGADTNSWQGVIDRAESRYDSASQQLFLIAQVPKPYSYKDIDSKHPKSKHPLRAGLFVRANITGKTLDNVFILPRRAVRRGNEVALSIKWHPPRAFPTRQEQNPKKPSQKGPPAKVKGKKKNKIPDILVRREIDVLWRDKKWIITQSLKKGDVLITTPIDYATNGQELDVNAQGEPPPNSGNGEDSPRK